MLYRRYCSCKLCIRWVVVGVVVVVVVVVVLGFLSFFSLVDDAEAILCMGSHLCYATSWNHFSDFSNISPV